jgi:CubicO group peptidase (beta-lactamase class C family)
MQRSENPSANGITNASSIARMYAGVMGDLAPLELLRPATLSRALECETGGLPEMMSGASSPLRYGIGYMLPSAQRPMLGPGSFGHYGSGGSIGVGDIDLHCAVGYVPNRMSTRDENDRRAESILAAVRSCL